MGSAKHFINLCNNYTGIINLSGMHIDKVVARTVRTKGQIAFERFFYIVEGVQTFILKDGRTVVAKKGDIIYLPPDITYVSKWQTEPKGKAMSILFSVISEDENSNISDDLFIMLNDKYGIYLNLFSHFIDVYEKGRLGYKIKCQSIFCDIYYTILMECMQKQENKKESNIDKGILYIENNYMDDINIDELAKMCYTSTSTFRRKFHNITGMSPIEYKNKLKMSKAAALLKTGEYNVKEAAAEVKINDVYYFSKMFKKYMNVTPATIKNNIYSSD